MDPVVEKLSIEGHGSELFSFLDEATRARLESHRGARVLLWSFGRISRDALASVPMWNSRVSCLAWRNKPMITKAEGERWASYRGFVTDDPLCQVPALTLVRLLFGNGYTCSLDDGPWIRDPADPQLRRLRYIRGYGHHSTQSPEWPALRESYVVWCIRALDIVSAGDEIPF